MRAAERRALATMVALVVIAATLVVGHLLAIAP